MVAAAVDGINQLAPEQGNLGKMAVIIQGTDGALISKPFWLAAPVVWATTIERFVNRDGNTGDKHYLKTALGVTGWLNHLDLTKDQPFPLSQQGPAMVFYVMENYSAGWPYVEEDKAMNKAALDKVNWCLNWIAEQQVKSAAERDWLPTKGWGMKFGGLPFHEYIFSHHLPVDGKLSSAADTEMRRLAAIVFAGKPEFTQLSAFMMMSYAERLNAGAMYRSSR